MTINTKPEAERRFLQKLDRILLGDGDLIVSKDLNNLRKASGFFLPFKKKSKEFEDYKSYLIELKSLNYHKIAHIMFSDLRISELEEAIKNEVGAKNHLVKSLSVENFVTKIEDARVEQKFVKVYPFSKKYFENKIYREASKGNVGFLDVYCRKFLENDFRKKLIMNSLNGNLYQRNPLENVSSSLLDDNTYHGLDQDLDKSGYRKLKKNLDLFLFSENKKRRIKKAADSFKLIPELYPNSDPPFGKDKGLSFKVNKTESVDIKKEVDSDLISELNTKELSNSNKEREHEVDEKSQDFVNDTEEELKKDVEEDEELIKKGGGWSPNSVDSKEESISLKDFFDEEMVTRKNQIKRVLKEIKLDMKEQWRRNERKGKIDLRSAMNAEKEGHSRIFKRYYPNKEKENSLAAILLIDKSGSMDGELIYKALKSCWSIRKALEELNEKVCVIAFDTDYKIIKDWFKEPNYELGAGGGTNPQKALKAADKKIEEILQFDRKLNPVIISITDSKYDPKTKQGIKKPIDRIKSLKNQYNSKIAEININEENPIYDKTDSFDYYTNCPNIEKLPEALEKIIKSIKIELLNKSTRLKKKTNF
ncbi:MAG: vWFA domain containing protein [Candidatus Methanohalarchaeum thermophilum]|uniref:VWFA domain containing protein n=1 Tax=Methanohalarchaeum thermophilum TaxID=1903181 RepID=A0A1Q6DVX6_METT1|nr:MAG: vWFA domain containing protein [Candidatus Methanohalarchaeum thermophilum]